VSKALSRELLKAFHHRINVAGRAVKMVVDSVSDVFPPGADIALIEQAIAQ